MHTMQMPRIELTYERFITVLYDSMEKNQWNGFTEWMCFKCGTTFRLYKRVAYNDSILQLKNSDFPHPFCSLCDHCYTPLIDPVANTNFYHYYTQQKEHQLISFTQDVLNTLVVGEADKRCNKCFLFNLLVCFIRSKIFKHILDVGGALMNLGIGTVCTVQGLVSNVGNWERADFLALARKLDSTNDAAQAARIILKVLKAF